MLVSELELLKLFLNEHSVKQMHAVLLEKNYF